MDPRARLLLVLAATVFIASTPASALERCLAYAALLFPLTAVPGLAWGKTLRRSLAALPFLALASGAILLRDGWQTPPYRAAASVMCNGMLISWMLAVLASTTAMTQLIAALQQMRVPPAFTQVLTLMIRYMGLFQEEHKRMDRARQSRTAMPLGRQRWAIHARQFGTLILRAFDRAERIHTAMCARGFNGIWPVRPLPEFSALQILILTVSVGAFAAVRLWP